MAAALAALWWTLPRGTPGKPLATLLWLPLLWPAPMPPPPGQVEFVQLDVGQGLAVLVRTHRHALLYDAGPAPPRGLDAGEAVVLPSLRALGVRRLDRQEAEYLSRPGWFQQAYEIEPPPLSTALPAPLQRKGLGGRAEGSGQQKTR